MRWKAEKGEIKLMIGASSEDIRLDTTLTLSEDVWIDGTHRMFYAENKS